MSAKHSPTPWRVSGSALYRGRNCIVVCGTDAVDVATEFENAALIGRAVNAHGDLFEALKAILPMAEMWADGKGSSHPDHEWLAFARAALAKAEA